MDNRFTHIVDPTYRDPADWVRVIRVIRRILADKQYDPTPAVRSAVKLKAALYLIHPLMDELGRKVCRFCPDPCCLTARVYFDRRDLLFFALTGLPIPFAQTTAGPNDVCRYLGPAGCTLARDIRPFVCTWYLCPTQKARLKRERRLSTVNRRLEQLVRMRKQTAALFIKTMGGEEP